MVTTAAEVHASSNPPLLAAVLAAVDALRAQGTTIDSAAAQLVLRLFQTDGRSLVRLARLFVDDRDAAEDIWQEAFLRLARPETGRAHA